jgi:hypothetical protein
VALPEPDEILHCHTYVTKVVKESIEKDEDRLHALKCVDGWYSDGES